MDGGKRKGGAGAMSEVIERLDVPKAPAPLRPGSPQAERLPIEALAPSFTRAVDARRLFVLLPFMLILGMILSLVGESGARPEALAGISLMIVAGLVLARGRSVMFRLFVLVAGFWGGFCLLPLHGALFGTSMLAWPAYGQYEARIDELQLAGGGTQRLVLSDITPLANARPIAVRRARITVPADQTFAPGDRISAAMRFYPVPGPVLPGGYDTQFHSYFDGIGAFGAATSTVEVVAAGADGPERLVEGVRREIAARIDARIVGDANGIARSMMIGDQSRISDPVRDVMAASGLAHIYSISGLHLSIVALGVFQVLRWALVATPGLGRRLPVKPVAAALAMLAAFAYLALAGGSSNVPAFRSTIMIALVLGAVLAGRRALTMRNVAIAALIIILTDPASVFRPSFQLSFAAVVALIGAYEWSRIDNERPRGAGGWLWRLVLGTAATSLVAGLATLLFSAFHFQQTAPLGILSNLMALILIGPIMAAIVIAGLLMTLGWEAPVLDALGVLLEALIWIATLVTGWSEGLSLHPLLTPLSLILGLLALGWFAVLQSWHRIIGPALLLPTVLLLAQDRPPDILISDTTRALAVRTQAGLSLVDGRTGTFAVDVWSETYGEPIGSGAGRCDALGCVASGAPGFVLALVQDPAGFFEDCGQADVVVSRRAIPQSCAAALTIDRDALAAGGVHWLAWNGAGFEVRRARTGLDRPWRARLD